ncbi:MAG: hypothetical protein ACHQZR_08940 [Candidatus Limnocylindrales bacterium]
MTDPPAPTRPSGGSDPLEARLTRWFAGELTRAEGDVQHGVLARAGRGGVRRDTTGRRVAWAGSLAGSGLAVLLVVAVIGGFLGGGVGPSSPATGTSPATGASPLATGTPAASGAVVMGPDGIPTSIDGQLTVSVPEALDRLGRSPSPASFLVRGYYAGYALPCPFIPRTVPPTPGSRLIPDNCEPHILGADPIPVGQDHATAADLNLTLGSDVDTLPMGAVVLEIHGHDPAAAACDPSIRAACEAAVIVDRVVWSAAPSPTPTAVTSGQGSLPNSIDGQPVLTVEAAQALSQTHRSPLPFLVGGYFETDVIQACALVTSPPPSDLIRWCGAGDLAAGPGDTTGTVIWPTFLGSGPPLPTAGWTVLQVHVDDPRAAACPAAWLASCESALIVDATVWSNGQPVNDPTVIGPDGLPTEIDGFRVLRGAAVPYWVGQATDDTSFLVGGWTPAAPPAFFCPFQPVPPSGATPGPVTRLLPCGGLWFLDAPTVAPGALLGDPPWVAVPIKVVSLAPAWGVPFVMRVHVQDPLASSCPTDQRAACRRSVIEESLVWVGP